MGFGTTERTPCKVVSLYANVNFNSLLPLDVKATIEQHSYAVEGAITWDSLRQLGMYQEDRILKAGLYRGEYDLKSVEHIETKWISWVKPYSAQPDFHIPSSFGILKLEP